MARGGKREGAGRKPSHLRSSTVRIDEMTNATLSRICRYHGVKTKTQMLAKLLEAENERILSTFEEDEQIDSFYGFD